MRMSKIYVLLARFDDGHLDTNRAFWSLHDACVFVARREGRDLVWTEHSGHGPCWSTPGWRIDELTIEGSK